MSLLNNLLYETFPTWDDPSECTFQRVTIDHDKCDGCKMCVIVCPARVLELVRIGGKRKAKTLDDITGCISCNNCMAICENDAIRATEHFRMSGYYESRGLGEFSPPRTSFSGPAATKGR